jgi:hypothetical protein
VTVSLIGGGNRRKPLTCRKSHIVVSAWTGFKLTNLVMIGFDCTGHCKSNYHTMTTTRGVELFIMIKLIKIYINFCLITNRVLLFYPTCRCPWHLSFKVKCRKLMNNLAFKFIVRIVNDWPWILVYGWKLLENKPQTTAWHYTRICFSFFMIGIRYIDN